MAKKPGESTKATAFRRQAEARLRMTKRDVAAMPVADVQQLVHELQVHQIELEMQNEELRQTQAELEAARDRYVELYDFSPAGHLTLDTDSMIVEANLRAETLLGINRQELIGQSLARFIALSDEGTFHRHRHEVVKTGTLQTCEVLLREEVSVSRWIYFESLAVHNERGPITHWRTALLDISERRQVESELRSSKSLLQSIIEHIPDMIFMKDAHDLRFVQFNKAGEQLIGLPREARLGKNDFDLFPRKQAEGFTAKDREILASNRLVDIPSEPVQTADKGLRWLHSKKIPIVDELGRPQFLLGISEDITDAKAAQEAEQARIERLECQREALLELVKDPHFHSGDLVRAFPAITERAARMLAVTRASIWLFDESRSVLVLSDLYDGMSTQHTEGTRLVMSRYPSYCTALVRESYALAVHDAVTNPDTCELAESYLVPLGIGAMLIAPVRKDGWVVGILCFEHVGGVRHWTDEEQIYTGSLATKVTLALGADERRRFHEGLEEQILLRTDELQQANQALRGTTDHLQTIIGQAPWAIIELNEGGRVSSWNAAATRIFGWTEPEVFGQEVPYVPENERQESTRLWETVMRGNPSPNRELRRQRKDGKLIDVSFWGTARRSAEGRVIGSIGFLVDITERKRLEAQSRQRHKMEALGRLAGGIAHDFNNLLTVINGYSALLLNQLHAESPRRMLAEEVLKSGERAAELTRQLLAFSRQQVLKLQPVDLNDSLRGVTPMLQRLIGEDLELAVDLAPDIWPMQADKGQIDQVVINLAVNARDAMVNGGRLTLTTENVVVTPETPVPHPILVPGEYVHLMVCDTGVGMAPEVLSNIFDPFFTTKSEGIGTGLGLATVYGIVKQSQGLIFVDSTPGAGTTCHLYFPRIEAQQTVAAAVAVQPRAGSERVLIVEDQESVRQLISRVLKGYGYEVFEAASGEEALQVAASLAEPIHLVVTDVIMPKLSGPATAERLRACWPDLRVLFMSGYTEEFQSTLLSMPYTSFIQKPFLPEELAAELRRLFDSPVDASLPNTP